MTYKYFEIRMFLRGVVAKVLDCGIVVSEFELQSRYYVHLGKSINLLIPPGRN